MGWRSMASMTTTTHIKPTPVLGGTGKTGRRVAGDFADYAPDAARSGVWDVPVSSPV